MSTNMPIIGLVICENIGFEMEEFENKKTCFAQ